MKKQILILIVALFALGISSAYAQDPSQPPTCTATALTPAPGGLYTYKVTVGGPGYDTLGNYRWYVTDNPDLIAGGLAPIPNGGPLFTASGVGSYNLPAGGGSAIDITWTSAALEDGGPFYLVIRYEGQNSSATPNCTAMNMKVYRIVPINTFWLKIESVADAAGTPGGVEQCAADITGATVTEPAGEVEYIFGQNVLYVKVTASGYTGNWDASLQLTGIVTDQTIVPASITWSSGASSGTFIGAGPYTATLPSTVAGTEIIITIPIDNNHHEALADQTIGVAIDGSYTSGATTFNDKWDAGPALAQQCVDQPAYLDTVDKIIKARPTINAVAPNTFVPEPLTQP